uniref:Uncharacterized protein n=1 Tax=Rhizophora mucronata TaxID=61149 RepID=A0A2P2NKK5_RHIMU
MSAQISESDQLHNQCSARIFVSCSGAHVFLLHLHHLVLCGFHQLQGQLKLFLILLKMLWSGNMPLLVF